MPREKKKDGRLLIGKNCQLGRLSYGAEHYCDEPVVVKIAGVRMCQKHKDLLDAIEADAKERAAA